MVAKERGKDAQWNRKKTNFLYVCERMYLFTINKRLLKFTILFSEMP